MRAAAGADFEDVHHRDLDRQRALVAADQRAAGRQRPAVADDAGLGRRAAHVEGDRIAHAELRADRLRADHARCRARLQHADAAHARMLRREQAAGRLHDIEIAAEALAAEVRLRARPGSRRRAARRRRWPPTVETRSNSRYSCDSSCEARDEGAGHFLLQDLLDALLVRRIAVGVQEQDRDGLDAACPSTRAPARARQPRRAPCARCRRRASRSATSKRSERWTSGSMLAEEQVVGVGPVDAPDLVDVAEALGDQQRRLRAVALEQRVDRDRRAVQEQIAVAPRRPWRRRALPGCR